MPLIAVNRMVRLSSERERIAGTDPLTSLANRTALMVEVAEHAATSSQRSMADGHHRQFALLVLDIDRFKYVNDALGHAVGDRLLVEIGRQARGVRLCQPIKLWAP